MSWHGGYGYGGPAPAGGREGGWAFVLTDAATGARVQDWAISSGQLGLHGGAGFEIRKRTLHGGRQEGVDVIEVDNGRLRVLVCPTRGMGVLRAESGDVTLGWRSPVEEVVHPAFVNLEARGGLGWLDGFSEMLARCGCEWSGHPGLDGDQWLTLHGRVANTPASRVVVHVDADPPHRIRIRGVVREQTFKFADLELHAEIATDPGTPAFHVHDTVTNRSDYAREFQLLYHGNFGPPLLEAGSAFVGPVDRVRPFDAAAAADMEAWTQYAGPTPGFGERVYLLTPIADADGMTTAMLRNRAGDRGVQLHYRARELPCLALWKNTDTLRQGYVTGVEPGTGFIYNRRIERAAGRVPTLAAGESRSFALEYRILPDRAAVDHCAAAVAAVQGDRPVRVDPEPEA